MSSAPGSESRGRGAAIAALVATTVFWAGNYVVGEIAVRSIDPLSLTFLRWAIATPILLVLAAIIERPDWRAALRALPRLAVLATLGMIGFVLPLYEALRTTTAVSAALISSVCPLLIALVAGIALRERPGGRMIAGLLVGLAGVVLVVSKGSLDALLRLDLAPGDLWVLLAVVCWTAYTVLGRRAAGVPPITSVAVQSACATILMLPAVAILGVHLPTQAPAIASLAFIVALPTIGSYLLWTIALRRIPAAGAGIFLNLIPVFTVVIALALGETIAPAEYVGGALVLAGVLLATWTGRPSDRTPTPPDAGPDTQPDAGADAPPAARPDAQPAAKTGASDDQADART